MNNDKENCLLTRGLFKSRWVRSYFGLKRLLDITLGKLRRSFSGLNYQELPRFLRFGGKSRYLWLKGKLMCIYTSEGSRNVIFKLQRMWSHWAQTRKWTLFFVFYASNMSIPWLNKKQSCKSFKVNLLTTLQYWMVRFVAMSVSSSWLKNCDSLVVLSLWLLETSRS